MIAQLLIFKALSFFLGPAHPIAAAFGVATGFAGRAAGGPVTAGRPYVVGERQAELFVPNQSGRIYPDAALAGAGAPPMNFSFDLSRLPAPTNPLAAARDPEWLSFISDTIRGWEMNGGRLERGNK